MNWYKQLRLATQLILAFVLVAIIAGAVGVIGIVNLGKLASSDKYHVREGHRAHEEPGRDEREFPAGAELPEQDRGRARPGQAGRAHRGQEQQLEAHGGRPERLRRPGRDRRGEGRRGPAPGTGGDLRPGRLPAADQGRAERQDGRWRGHQLQRRGHPDHRRAQRPDQQADQAERGQGRGRRRGQRPHRQHRQLGDGGRHRPGHGPGDRPGPPGHRPHQEAGGRRAQRRGRHRQPGGPGRPDHGRPGGGRRHREHDGRHEDHGGVAFRRGGGHPADRGRAPGRGTSTSASGWRAARATSSPWAPPSTSWPPPARRAWPT